MPTPSTPTDVGGTSQPLTASRDDQDTPEANAVVWVNGCTGTLIAPDLVVTAGHCFDRPADVRHPWSPPPGSGCTDTMVPARWYPIGARARGAVNVGVGRDRRAFHFQTRATDCTIPGCADIIVFRLTDPVPDDLARPIKVLSGAGAGSGATDAVRFRGEVLTQVGWGLVDSGDTPQIRQIGSTSYTSHDEEKMYVNRRSSGSHTQPGDSGGPLLWTHRSGKRYVIAVLQGYEGRGDRYTPTFRNPAKGDNGALVPSVAEFFRTVARPAVLDDDSLAGPAGTLPLLSWWSHGRQDNWTTTDPIVLGSAGTIQGPDYGFNRLEGYVFNPELPQPPRTVRLFRWFDPDRGDNHTTSEPDMIRWAGDGWTRDPNYRFSRLEGYAFSPEYDQPAGTVPLYRWWSPSRKDNHTTTQFADRGGRGEGLSPDYQRPLLLGYVFPPARA